MSSVTSAIGLMSGTSVDGIDAALVVIAGDDRDLRVELRNGCTYPYPPTLRDRILAACSGKPLAASEFAELNDEIAASFAAAAMAIQAGFPPADLIGSHGQTIFHRPTEPGKMGYSWQLGRGEAIAAATGITTVSNFRVADIAIGGQGAPLVPKTDAILLSDENQVRCVQNIGGIANFTYLPPRSSPDWETKICGWDTGPGNSLIDLAVAHYSKGELTYDADGAWAATGTIEEELLNRWLAHPYFTSLPPKSTGRELFGFDYFKEVIAETERLDISPANCLATLVEFTARTIVSNYRDFLPQLPTQVLLCGGGSHNLYLRKRLQILLPTAEITTTDACGLNGDYKEAIAFAILAYWRIRDIPSNLPAVTGAPQPTLLGEVHRAT
jgi:anhydro-N-acetylmuramic acid kinase